MNPTDAVPTNYNGTLFRSRLEADWARTLDFNGITWNYEPETITLPSGATYIPDFYLPRLRTWIEVKGPDVPRIEKAYEFARTRDELVLIGREALRDDGPRRTRHGYANWETAYGPSAYFVTCLACANTQWVPLGRRMFCRVCNAALHEMNLELR